MEYNSPEFRKWLDKLQRESWQLELIISGFAIYGLIMASDPLSQEIALAMENDDPITMMLWSIGGLAVFVLTLNLVVHVVLRGLWIGAIGLRYVSGDIEYNKLGYSEKFTKYLKRKVGSFDRYISRLENYCSIIFALSFLLIFYMLAYFLVTFFVMGIVFIIRDIGLLPEKIAKIISRIFTIIMLLASSVVFIDFLGQGFLKKRKWTSLIYFPIYRVFSFLTISFLYRPLAYNFLDNKFARRLSLMIVPFYIGLIILVSFNMKQSNYLTHNDTSSESYVNIRNYEDLLIDEETFVQIASIPSKVVQSNYLKVFILYSNQIEDFIFEKNSGLKPEKDRRGFNSEILNLFNDEELDLETISKSYLKTFSQTYTVAIDSLKFNPNFIIGTNKKNRLGFESYLNIKNLKEGKHILTISGPSKENKFEKNSKTIQKTLVTIPFWYFPENSGTSSINNQEVVVDSLTNE